jgi:hypothetical protein
MGYFIVINGVIRTSIIAMRLAVAVNNRVEVDEDLHVRVENA